MEENKDIKIIRKAATELKLPLWRDALDEYIKPLRRRIMERAAPHGHYDAGPA